MKQKSILMDVMLGNHFECQIEYPFRGYPLEEIDGQVVEVIDNTFLRTLIEAKRPSLKGKGYHVEFTNQKV